MPNAELNYHSASSRLSKKYFSNKNVYILLRQFKRAAPTTPLGFASTSGRKGFGAGSVFEEAERPSVVLMDDFLAEHWLIGPGMTRKRDNDSIDLNWNTRSEILHTSGSLPLDQAGDKLWDVRTRNIGF